MQDLEKKHYNFLKEKYDYLVKNIMGSDYYTNSIHVFDADVEAFNDIKKKVIDSKNELKMWRIIAIVMTIISMILIIFK